MYAGKPIIGLSGGIGAGKTYVAGLFAEMDCLVISSDALVRQVYLNSQVKAVLSDWWGSSVLLPDGEVDRPAVARKIFGCKSDRLRLERLLHPRVADLRQAKMAAGADDSRIVAFVWDTPLLFETGLSAACDVTVFVDSPETVRIARVVESRGWDAAELARREKSQMPLDRKRSISDYNVVSTTNADSTRTQVRELLSRILVGLPRKLITGQTTPA